MAAMAISAAVFGQPSLTHRTYPPEDLRFDLMIVRSSLERAHPDPYRYLTSTEMDLLFEGIASKLTLPLTAEEFGRRLLPIFRAIGDGNTYLSPSLEDMEIYEHTEPLLPLLVAVIDDRLFVVEELKGFSSFPTGSELLEVNGRSAKKILGIIRSSLVPEGSDTTRLDRRIEQDLPLLYRRFVERAESFNVTYRTPEGKVDQKVVFALTRDQMRVSNSRSGLRRIPWSLEMVPALSTCWLTLGTMDRTTLDRSRVDTKRFIEDTRSLLRKSTAKTLVIDLRNTKGDDMTLADQVFSLIAQEPYQAFSAMSIRSGNVADSNKYSAPGPEFYVSLGAGYGPEVNGRRDLKADDPRLQPKQPRSNAFTGKVYVICNGLTVDAAATLVMMAKRSGRAHILGEETGTNATSFCAGAPLKIELPRTDLILRIPLTRYEPYGTSSGAPERGEMPYVQIGQEASDLASGSDTVRDRLLELIGETR